MRRTLPLVLVAAVLALIAARGPNAAAAPGDAKRKVARIVFVGKQNACDCTRKAIEAGRKALQAALGNTSRYRLEELKIDVDREKVDGLRKKRALAGLPAIYFLDAAGDVKELLQGDITEEQIRAALK
jgi:hypothetical protein